MADVRAEILAASRSRTGWLEGSVQNNESQPFVSKVKSTFEEKTANQDNKLVTNTSKSEAVRRLGSKVSSIATLFQSFSPHKNECPKTPVQSANKGGVEKTSPKIVKSDQVNKIDSNTEISSVSQNDVENHQKRFNSARAIFEQLGEKGKESNRLSDSFKGDFSPDSFDSGSSKFSVNERDKMPNQSNRNSSQSSPEEELRNLPYCRKSFNHRAPSQQKSERKCEDEKGHSETVSSPDNSQDHSHFSDYTDNLTSHYSQIYEEIPNSGKESSKYSWNPYSEPFERSENSLKTQDDKNANTTHSYNDSFSSHSKESVDSSMPIYAKVCKEPVDSSMPIYAKVIKKRSKPPANHNQEDQKPSVIKKNSDISREYKSGVYYIMLKDSNHICCL